MTKISKNIKRLRNSQNISQEVLAERLFISRQAVSSWENDRTQPDIEMIGKLAEVFNVSVEELIYGEKRKIEIENEEPRQNNRLLIIIFSILGSAFVTIGLIFFIVFGWEYFGTVIKTALGLLPMLAGQSVAIYTYKRKMHSIAFTESGALVWSVGVVSTLFLINGILGINISHFTLFALSTVLILPAIYIFNSTSVLFGYFVLALTTPLNNINDFATITFLIISLLLGGLYVTLNKHKVEDFRHNLSLWFLVISVFIGVIELLIGLNTNLFMMSFFAVLLTGFTFLFTFSKERDFKKPFYLLGSLGLLGTLIFLSLIDTIDSVEIVFTQYYFKDQNLLPNLFINLIILLAIIDIGAFCSRNTLVKNPLKIAILLIGSISTILALICADTFVPFAIILTVLLSISFIVIGSKSNKLYEVNIGLISIIIIMFKIITEIGSNYLALGFAFLLSGIILFIVNFLLINKSKKEKALTQNNNSELVEDGDLNV